MRHSELLGWRREGDRDDLVVFDRARTTRARIMGRLLQPAGLAERRVVVEIRFQYVPRGRTRYWMIVDNRDLHVDVCLVHPGEETTIYLNGELRALTQVWMGDVALASTLTDGRLVLVGPSPVVRSFKNWLKPHPVLGGIATAVAAEDLSPHA